MQHGRDQNRQLVPLRLTLPRQPLGQLRLNPFRPNRDPIDLCHRSIPCRKPHGIVCITTSFSPSTYPRRKLIEGKFIPLIWRPSPDHQNWPRALFRSKFQTMSNGFISYYPETDTMAIELRTWPGDGARGEAEIGGEDAGEDLVIHYAPDGEPWLWEIEHASRHPEHIAAALALIRSRMATRNRREAVPPT